MGGQAAQLHLMLQELDQMPGDGRCAGVRRGEGQVAVGAVRLDDGGDLRRINAEDRLADQVGRLGQRDRHPVRRQGGAVVDVVHPLQRRILPAVDLKDDAVGAVQPGLVVADGGGGDQRPVLTDAGHLDHRRLQRPKETLPGHRRHLRQVHIEIFHLALVDLLAGDGVGVIGQAELDAVRLGQRAVQFRAGRGAGPDLQLEGIARRVLGLDPLGQRHRHDLWIARAGETARAHGRVGRD